MQNNTDFNQQDDHKVLQSRQPAATYQIDRHVWLNKLGRTAQVTLIISLLLLAFSRTAPSANAQGYFNAVVGNGSPESCTESAFDDALTAVQAAQDGEITFNCGGQATIIFSGQKYIDTQLISIDGGGQITLSGGNITRIFSVLSGNLELRNITLANGYTIGHGGAIMAGNNTSVYLLNSTIQNSRTNAGFGGGAILSFDTNKNFPSVEIENSVIQFNESGYGAINTVGQLVIRDSVIRGNKALNLGGGLSVGGGTEITDSQIVDNESATTGGGLFITKSGSVLMKGGLIQGNKAGSLGGGIYNGGSIILEDVSVNQNLAVGSSGGGMENLGVALVVSTTFAHNSSLRFGGAIGNNYGNLSLQNVTLSNNDARVGTSDLGGGAILNYRGKVYIDDSTLVDNVGNARQAIYFDSAEGGSLTIHNTIMVSRDGSNCGGQPADNISYSLIDDNSCLYKSGTGNINKPPLIEDLADNGGPTLTHMIAANSPAIDAAECSLNFDQRGIGRPQGAGCDIGAVERRANEGPIQPMAFLPMILR